MIETIIVEVPNPGASLRRARRGRNADRAAPRRHRQRHPPCHRRADARTADVAAALWKAMATDRDVNSEGQHDMPIVFVPPGLRDLTGGMAQVAAPGSSVGAVIDALEGQFPGIKARFAVVIPSRWATSLDR